MKREKEIERLHQEIKNCKKMSVWKLNKPVSMVR